MLNTMQPPTYLYASDFDREVQWRSNFSIVVPVLLGLIQLILTVAIIGLEIASVIISPLYGTLYAGFWCSVVFTLSWVSMLGLVCCHRARKWATYLFLVSLLCAAAATTLIVLDALFIANIGRCFFSQVICDDIRSTYNRISSQPLGRKVQILKGQLACAALMVATALLYILLYIIASLSIRRGANRVLVEDYQLPRQLVRQVVRESSPPSPRAYRTSVPIAYDPTQIGCPQCGTQIKLTQRKRYVQVNN